MLNKENCLWHVDPACGMFFVFSLFGRSEVSRPRFPVSDQGTGQALLFGSLVTPGVGDSNDDGAKPSLKIVQC